MLVQNPGATDAKVTLDFLLPVGSKASPYSFTLKGNTRRTVHLDTLSGLAATDVSTKVSSTQPVVAERAMYFNYHGKDDGSDSIGVTAPGKTWYMAEGYTGGDFKTYVLVQNPGTTDATVTMDFQLPSPNTAPSKTYTVKPGTRMTVLLNDLEGLSGTDVSTKVSSNVPVVVERSMYFNYYGKNGGSDCVGIPF